MTPLAVNQGLARQVYNWLVFNLPRGVVSPCRLCGAGAGPTGLCAACTAELPALTKACPHCAEPGTDGQPCGRCLRRPPPVRLCVAACRYRPPVDEMIKALKFHGDLAAGRELGELLAQRLRGLEPPQLLLPMPLHPQRLRQRGYNQALELARPLHRTLGVPLAADLLQRLRPTAVQSELPARRRRMNVRGAFQAAPLQGLQVALVDDVLTTGHTAFEAARALRRAGARRVDVWVVARAGWH